MPKWLLRCGAAILLTALAGADDAPALAEFAVTHFPTEAYVGEPVTFTLVGTPGATVTATLTDQPLATAVFADERLELTCRFKTSGRLVLTQGQATRVFHLLLPGEPARLRASDGFLFSEQGPVILLLHHRHPPRHDRAWEAARALASLVGPDQRPLAHSVALAGAGYLGPGETPALAARGWTWYPPAAGGDDLAAALAALDGMKPADVLVLALARTDLERGASLLSFRQRVEWFLQGADRKKFPRVVVVAPLFDRFSRERFPEVAGQLRIAAGANDAALILPAAEHLRQPLTAADWLPLVTDKIGSQVLLP